MIQAVVEKYDSDSKTARVVTCETFPIFYDGVRVHTIFTNDLIIHYPLTEGTAGLLLFPQECQDFVFNGNIEKITNFDSLSPIFLPGFNSQVQTYDVPANALYIKYKGTEITIEDQTVKISNDTAELLSEIVKSLEKIVDITSHTQYICAAPGAPTTPAPSYPAILIEYQTIINKIKTFQG